MTQSQNAVFLSYASQDAEAALRICEALRAAGIEVWFDQSELRGGDAWDRKIRNQIRDCALFIPIISAHSEARLEGYFRREWKLAADRTHDMADEKPFLVPVVIDGTSERGASTPERFHEVQWTRLPDGATSPEFIERIARLLSASTENGGGDTAAVSKTSIRNRAAARRIPVASMLLAVCAVFALGYFLIDRLVLSKHSGEIGQVAASAAPSDSPVPAAVSEKSIAVLPFVDMSEKHDQEYFSDGLSEELIDLLAKVPDLRVPARTSSFYFKGKPTQIADIAKALNVSNVLEGSVRRAGSAVRITAHLIRVNTGYDVWSQTYDREIKDIFKVQDEIAGAVVQSLKLQLLTNTSTADRTANMDAYPLLLQGRYLNDQGSEADFRNAIRALQRAVSLDSSYAAAWAELANSYVDLSVYVDSEPAHDMESGRDAIQKALALNPADAAAHYLLAQIKIAYEHDWDGALAEIDAARRADPNLTEPDYLAHVTGCVAGPCLDKYVRDISRDIERDPFNADALLARGYAHYYAGELEAAESDVRRSLEVSPDRVNGKLSLGLVLIARHKTAEALTVMQGMEDSYWRRTGLAMVYDALGRKDEANAALQTLLAKDSRDAPYEIAQIYAERGNNSAALDWLQRDYDLKMWGILDAKVDPLFKPLAHEPRFIALMNKFGPSG